jgi:hypothetical protein
LKPSQSAQVAFDDQFDGVFAEGLRQKVCATRLQRRGVLLGRRPSNFFMTAKPLKRIGGRRAIHVHR